MKITTIGLDVAKNVLQMHAVDERGKTVLRKSLKRAAAVLLAMRGAQPCPDRHHLSQIHHLGQIGQNILATQHNNVIIKILIKSISYNKIPWTPATNTR